MLAGSGPNRRSDPPAAGGLGSSTWSVKCTAGTGRGGFAVVETEPGLSGFGTLDRALIALIVETGSLDVPPADPALPRGFCGGVARVTRDNAVVRPAESDAPPGFPVTEPAGVDPSTRAPGCGTVLPTLEGSGLGGRRRTGQAAGRRIRCAARRRPSARRSRDSGGSRRGAAARRVPGAGPASIWAAAVDEAWLGAAGAGWLDAGVEAAGVGRLFPVDMVAGPGALAASEEGGTGCCAGVLAPAEAGDCTVLPRLLSTRPGPSMTRGGATPAGGFTPPARLESSPPATFCAGEAAFAAALVSGLLRVPGSGDEEPCSELEARLSGSAMTEDWGEDGVVPGLMPEGAALAAGVTLSGRGVGHGHIRRRGRWAGRVASRSCRLTVRLHCR